MSEISAWILELWCYIDGINESTYLGGTPLSLMAYT